MRISIAFVFGLAACVAACGSTSGSSTFEPDAGLSRGQSDATGVGADEAGSVSRSDAALADDVATSPRDASGGDASAFDASDGSAVTEQDPCSGPDPGNSDPAHALTYVIGATLSGCIRNYQAGYIEFTTPPDPKAGGYVVVSFTGLDIETGLQATQYLADDTSPGDFIFMEYPGNGTSLTYWFAVAPSTAYLIEVEDPSGIVEMASFTLNVTFTGAVDPNKPNDDDALATPIQVGTPVQGLAFHGYTSYSSFSDTGWDSFYKLTLAATTTTVTITNVPVELELDAYLYGPEDVFSNDGYGSSTSQGASFTFTGTVTAGTSYVQVEPAFNPNAYGSGSTPPSYVVSPYTLLVTQ